MNIYLSGIGGAGIGPLAEIVHDIGHQVQGSDANDSAMVTQLREKGIAITIGQDGSFLRALHEDSPIDWFVYTAALPDDHPELLYARSYGIKTTKRDELLACIISEKNLKLIACAGTHGKTTTAAMMVWTMQQLNVPISYSVGATMSFGPSGRYSPASEYFIYECDEFDRNFLHFTPHVSLISSLDYDHPDSYPTKQEYQEAFRDFAQQSNQVIGWARDGDTVFKGLTSTTLLNDTQVDGRMTLPGAHNRQNATLVLHALDSLGVASDAVEIINSFPGAHRRFEKIHDNMYSDYAHHPIEIAATLQLASELSDTVVVIYQPHQNVRQHDIAAQYTDCFEGASKVLWTPTYLSREDPRLPILQPQELIKNLTNREAVDAVDLDESIVETIQHLHKSGALILFMGAGSIDEWAKRTFSP